MSLRTPPPPVLGSARSAIDPAPAFDRAARVAATRLGLPIGLVTLSTHLGGQVVIGAHGLTDEGRRAASSWAFPQDTTRRRGPSVVGDTQRDARLARCPGAGIPGVRGFAAVPLSPTGEPITGAVAVAGAAPFAVTSRVVDILLDVAADLVGELRRDHGRT